MKTTLKWICIACKRLAGGHVVRALSLAVVVGARDDSSGTNEKCAQVDGGGAKSRVACTKHCKHNATGEKIGSNGGGCDDSSGGRH